MRHPRPIVTLAAVSRKQSSTVVASRRSVFGRGGIGLLGLVILGSIVALCLGSLPWTLAPVATGEGGQSSPRFNAGSPRAGRLPPFWWPADPDEARRMNALVDDATVREVAARHGLDLTQALTSTDGPAAAELRRHWPRPWLGTDALGRDLLVRCLAGGGISLGIGIAAALLSVLIGTIYGALAAYLGGLADAAMMRIVDVLYGLPYVLLVVLLAVASDALLDEHLTRAHARAAWVRNEAAAVARERGLDPAPRSVETLLAQDEALRASIEARAAQVPRLRPRTISEGARAAFDLTVLLAAIGGVSWLTMARVVRGQVLSLKARPFMEAARAIGVPWRRQLVRHILPNLVGPIVVYATLTVPQAILQESFLSFLGIGVRPPLPSWGNLAADGLGELNAYKSRWWLLVFPCLLLGVTLVALNFVGEGLREAMDPRRRRRP